MTRCSIVVPAHDEAAVIGRTLSTLLAGAEVGEFDVVVAANACTDATVAVARSFPGVRVLDIARPGKTSALNAADAAVTGFPRIYLDADVELDAQTARALVDALAPPDVHAATPSVHHEASRTSRAVRLYLDVWRQLATGDEAPIGTGVYALDAEGHAHVSPFPDVIADDDYVRRRVPRNQWAVAPGTTVVRPPRHLLALVRSGVRVRVGNAQLDLVEAAAHHERRTARLLLSLARSPGWWPGVAVFVGVGVTVRTWAALRRRRGGAAAWTRDMTSRDGDE